jgi:ubiquinone/menaquinone biosynthesis C-methylase UbiE
MSTPAAQQPSPQLFFQTMNAYQRTEALKAAIQLEVFTAIGEGKTSTEQIAERCKAAERGVRILCDFLTIMGMLTKENDQYALTIDSAVFLDKRSPAYLGSAIDFLGSPMLTVGSKNLADAVRKGGTIMENDGTVGHDNQIWVTFARAMAPLMTMPSQLIAKLVDPEANRPLKVLDIAAGHGLFGIAFSQNNPQAEITGLDWPGVLEVAKENAARVGVADRYHTIPGSAFDVHFGSGYDVVLLTNFLHHFDIATNESILRKVHASLADGGRAVTLEFIPNDDRVTPPEMATFAMIMLATTPSGDAYTFKELEKMFAAAGFKRSTLHEIPPAIEPVVISEK